MDRREQNLTATLSRREPWGRLLLVILAGSAALRVWLVLRGGQFFWPDESRFYAASESLERLAAGDRAGFFHHLLGGADHLFFKVLALLPAEIMRWTGYHPSVPGLFCAAFSVANIYLVWRIARSAGAAPREACVAALLLAAANTNFYYARHLFPYDAAMTFCLLALLTGWTGGGWRRSLGCGLLAGLGFLTYNGYWLFGAMVLVGHVLAAGTDLKKAGGRAAAGALGLMLPIVLFIGLARWLAGVDLVASFLGFSHGIDQGDFGRGWKLLLEYFWAAEGPNQLLGLLGLLLVAGGALAAGRWHYGMRWVAGVLAVAVGLLFFSDVWPKFVIYGRTARQLVPFVCLAGAFALERLWRTEGSARRWAGAVLIAVLAQAVVNFSRPLQQSFPLDFQPRAAERIKQAQVQGETRQLVVINAGRILGKQDLVKGLPDHDVIMAADNPMQFRPYLYEGTTEAQRAVLAGADIRMQLIALNAARFNYPAKLRLPYPGVVQLTLRLPRDKPGVHEPLLVTGRTGAGDLIYVIYESPSAIRLGFDHWNAAGTVSEPVTVDYSKPLKIILSDGALHEARGTPPATGEENPAPDPRHWLYAEVNGQVVWSRPADFHPAAPATIAFGANYIGGSTCNPKFTGSIVKVESLLLPPVMTPRPPAK